MGITAAASERMMSLRLSAQELDLLRRLVAMDETLEKRLELTPAADGLRLTVSELLDLCRWLCLGVNQSPDEIVQRRLDQIQHRAQHLLPEE